MRTIYYFYREHNKNCLCGINLVFVLRYALPAVICEIEMARSLRLNLLQITILRVITSLHLKALYLSYWTLISGILTVGVAEEGRPQFSECTQ